MPGADHLFSLSLSFLADKRKMMSSASWCCYDKEPRVDWKSKHRVVGKVSLPVVTLQVRVGNAETGCHSPGGILQGEKGRAKAICTSRSNTFLSGADLPALWTCHSGFILSSFSFKITVFILIHTAF